jgi:hypothetical protein
VDSALMYLLRSSQEKTGRKGNEGSQNLSVSNDLDRNVHTAVAVKHWALRVCYSHAESGQVTGHVSKAKYSDGNLYTLGVLGRCYANEHQRVERGRPDH